MATKLLLLQDVMDLGRSGDIVSVKPGYARNFLLPKRFAVVADRNAIRMQERLQEERKKKAAEDKKDSEALVKQLEEVVVEAKVKLDPEGHMYGSVSALDIVQLLDEQKQITLDKHFIQLKHPFKQIGVHPVNLKLNEGVEGSFTVKIVAEEAENEA